MGSEEMERRNRSQKVISDLQQKVREPLPELPAGEGAARNENGDRPSYRKDPSTKDGSFRWD